MNIESSHTNLLILTEMIEQSKTPEKEKEDNASVEYREGSLLGNS